MNRSIIFRPAWLRGLSGRVDMLPLVGLSLLGLTSQASVDPVVRTIVVGKAPVAVEMDRTTGRAFVVNQGSNTVTVLDTRTGTLLRSVAVGKSPIAVVMDRVGDRAFVVNRDSNTISVLDASIGRATRGRSATARF